MTDSIAEIGSEMRVLEALRRRRMHRFFDGSQLDEEILKTLAWAATRAPTGGN